MAIVFGSLAIGENSVLTPDYSDAKLSAQRILALIRRKPKIDPYSEDGLTPVSYLNFASLFKFGMTS